MSSYRHIEPIQVLNSTVSGTTVANSIALDVKTMTKVGFQIIWGAGLAATFQVMGSVDGTNYSDMQVVINPATIANGADSFLVNMPDVCFSKVFIRVTPTSGAANVMITGMAKGV